MFCSVPHNSPRLNRVILRGEYAWRATRLIESKRKKRDDTSWSSPSEFVFFIFLVFVFSHVSRDKRKRKSFFSLYGNNAPRPLPPAGAQPQLLPSGAGDQEKEDDSAPRRDEEARENDPVAVLPRSRGDRDKSFKRFLPLFAHLPLLNSPIDPPHEQRRRLLHRDRPAPRLARSSPGPRRGPRRRVLRRRRFRRRRRLHLSSSPTPAAPRSLPSPRRSWSWARLRDPPRPSPEEEVRNSAWRFYPNFESFEVEKIG